MLQIAKLFRWKAVDTLDTGWLDDSDAIIGEVFPDHPRQWPGGAYVESLRAGARPWHKLEEYQKSDPGWAAEVAATVRFLRSKHNEMVAEVNDINGRAEGMARQNECISDPRREGSWRQHPVFYRNSSAAADLRDVCTHEAADNTPVACAAVRAIARGFNNRVARDGGSTCVTDSKMIVMRAAYSSVDGDAWIRPHTGPTNAQLKLHYGIL